MDLVQAVTMDPRLILPSFLIELVNFCSLQIVYFVALNPSNTKCMEAGEILHKCQIIFLPVLFKSSISVLTFHIYHKILAVRQ